MKLIVGKNEHTIGPSQHQGKMSGSFFQNGNDLKKNISTISQFIVLSIHLYIVWNSCSIFIYTTINLLFVSNQFTSISNKGSFCLLRGGILAIKEASHKYTSNIM